MPPPISLLLKGKIHARDLTPKEKGNGRKKNFLQAEKVPNHITFQMT